MVKTKSSPAPITPVVLPNGKIGTLPPRKRARTKEEKEQRRIERIIRNRRAAHTSREKKRRHVEQLEKYAKQLEQCIARFSDTQSQLVGIQNQLVFKLDDAGIDYTDIDLDLKLANCVDRPDNLDLDTSSRPIKRQKSNPKEESPMDSPLSEIPSPPFEAGLKAEKDSQSSESTQSDVSTQQFQGIFTPPPSTSSSKFKLDENDILKQDYSPLFDDDDIFMPQEKLEADNSLKLFEQNIAGNEAEEAVESKMALGLLDQSSDVFHPDNMDYLNCLNDVHHSAVMMSL
ncbi:hypothetical protein FOA43_002084 [Brettanomyces nanus]|uniref:BZIP domain-containing protein n=1 Tax=Eeniella nana TaxID=13502 RepID=A0A875RYZ0_EENNA|nr:uncharacterized protein FOA43_002084 [Brettanomyces nanus]QPG74751.1 hypothetical protein FOA43_002084 [Brettanomyces nanus]